MGWGELYEFDDALSGLKELRKLEFFKAFSLTSPVQLGRVLFP